MFIEAVINISAKLMLSKNITASLKDKDVVFA